MATSLPALARFAFRSATKRLSTKVYHLRVATVSIPCQTLAQVAGGVCSDPQRTRRSPGAFLHNLERVAHGCCQLGFTVSFKAIMHSRPGQTNPCAGCIFQAPHAQEKLVRCGRRPSRPCAPCPGTPWRHDHLCHRSPVPRPAPLNQRLIRRKIHFEPDHQLVSRLNGKTLAPQLDPPIRFVSAQPQPG